MLGQRELHLQDELALLELEQRAADRLVRQVHVLADFFGFEAAMIGGLHEVREVQVRDRVHDDEVDLLVEDPADDAEKVLDVFQLLLVDSLALLHAV